MPIIIRNNNTNYENKITIIIKILLIIMIIKNNNENYKNISKKIIIKNIMII